MRTLPTTMIQALAPFAPLFSKRVWGHVQVLLAGTILAPGKRTVTSALRAVGLEEERQFCRYHRVPNCVARARANVSVLKGGVCAFGAPDSKVSRGTHTAILVPPVLQATYPPGAPFSVLQGPAGTAVGRTLIH